MHISAENEEFLKQYVYNPLKGLRHFLSPMIQTEQTLPAALLGVSVEGGSA